MAEPDDNPAWGYWLNREEIDVMAKIATYVLELGSRANSARTDERLRHLAMLLRRYKDVQTAAAFLDQYKDQCLRTVRRD
jgi:hypothetical protein